MAFGERWMELWNKIKPGKQVNTRNFGSIYGDGVVHATYKDSPEEKYDLEQAALRARNAQSGAEVVTVENQKNSFQKLTDSIQEANEKRSVAAKAKLTAPIAGTLPVGALELIKEAKARGLSSRAIDALMRRLANKDELE